MNCIALLQRIGLLHPYQPQDVLAAEKENMIRDNETAIERASSSAREVRAAALVALATIRYMKESE